MKILLTHTPRFQRQYFGERNIAALRSIAEVRLHEGDATLTPTELIGGAQDVDLIIAERATEGPADVFAQLPNLRAFLRCAVDIRTIDVGAASRAGVLVTRTGPGIVRSMSELALGFLVDLSRGLSRSTADYRAGRKPEVRVGRQLSGSIVGLIGYGTVGRDLAPMLLGLGMTVLVADPYVAVDDPRFQQVDLGSLLKRADYVVCLAAATTETENLIDGGAFARMRRDAFFVNLSRGNLVDEAALGEALSENRIAGAALDVGRAPDQMPSPDIAQRPNVVATPHIGGLTAPSIDSQALDTIAQVKAILAGETPPGAVNLEAWTRRFSRASSSTRKSNMPDHILRLVAPAGTCDTHLHIYDPAMPVAPTAMGPGPAWANVAAYRAVQKRLGIERAVVVQPTTYGLDNRCTLNAIAELGLDNARGVAVVDASVADAELARLTDAGIRGVRFQMLGGGALPWDALEPVAARIAPFGWHILLQMDGRLLPEREAMLAKLPATLVIDHVGKFLEPVPVADAAFQTLLRLLGNGRTWLKLTAAYEVSKSGPPTYADVGALAKAAVKTAPERMIWASNWPHVSVKTLPDDAALMDLMLEWAPDEKTRNRILVDNPAKLYGF